MNSIEDIFRQSGGWFDGHTKFRNGYHGNGWIEKGYIVRKPRLLDLVTKIQAEQIVNSFQEFDIVVGPIVNGAIVSSFVAKHLDKEFTITMGKDEDIEFHRMYVPHSSKKVILVEDLIFTGNDVTTNIKFLKRLGFDVEGVSVWINRQDSILEDTKIISLVEKPPFEYYEEESCPLCKQDIPVKYENIRE